MSTCEFDGCASSAVATVHAQWTLVDFLDFEMCEEHVADAADILDNRSIDGQLPIDVWVSYWDTDEDVSSERRDE